MMESNRLINILQKSDMNKIDFKESMKYLSGIKTTKIGNNHLYITIRTHDKRNQIVLKVIQKIKFEYNRFQKKSF